MGCKRVHSFSATSGGVGREYYSISLSLLAGLDISKSLKLKYLSLGTRNVRIYKLKSGLRILIFARCRSS